MVVAAAVALAGCAAGSGSAGGEGRGAGSAAANSPTGSPDASARGGSADNGNGSSDRQIVAVVNGDAIPWSALRRRLVEAAGGDVLASWVLDRRITQALRQRGLRVEQRDVAAEKSLMLSQLSDDEDEATRLLERIREQRGLGPDRFEALLARNAGLRKLIAGQVTVSDSMVEQAYERQYGQKTVVRMILVPSLREASELIREVEEGASFIDLAVERSHDSSRRQGGLLPPVSAQDPTYPKALRETAVRLEVGQVSQPVALESGFAILKCERKIESEDVKLEEVEQELRRQVRLRAERAAMQRKARELLDEAEVTVLDAELNEAWQRQRDALLRLRGSP